MADKVQFTGVVQALGKVDCGGAIKALLCNLDGKRIRITVETLRKRRSLSQNAYYHGVVVPAIRDLLLEYGNDVSTEETHEFLKLQVGKLRGMVTTPDGEVLVCPVSTRKLSTTEFEDYMEKCRAFAAEHGVVIKMPNEE